MEIKLEKVDKRFGSVKAVNQLDLHIKEGEMVALLGPSGCGKTTTLFMLAGIYQPTGGVIRFGNEIVNYLRPQDRKIGMVFQSYALYPHMSVFENIAFPLKIKKESSSEIKRRVHKIAELVQIGQLLKRKPAELSGGQQQRVSLARALVKEPELLLLDEPLSNLDAGLRLAMRAEIRRIQRELGITAIFVTHDQTEAMTMADKISLMKDGYIEAYGSPMELYQKPEKQFVAEFLGSPRINLIPVKAQDRKIVNEWDNGVITVLAQDSINNLESLNLAVRSENLTLTVPSEGDIKAKVVLVEAHGHEYLYTISYGSHVLRVRTPKQHSVKEGEDVGIRIDWSKVHWFDNEGLRVDLELMEN